MVSIHLLAVVHGMWGNPGHVAELIRIMGETALKTDSNESGIELRIIAPETNREGATYDGIDWGGERVAEEILQRVADYEEDGHTVTRFSLTGYSLGGLIARYVIGILSQKGFFENVEPMNFNTIATPHIGLLRSDTFMGSLFSTLGPKLLSRTGEQFYCVDSWASSGRPLLDVMADPTQIFYKALTSFKHFTIYANAVSDRTVPYNTAAIEAEDPYFDMENTGLQIQLEEGYEPIVKSYSLPATPPIIPPKPKALSREWFKKVGKSVALPPFLQIRFPGNVVIYLLIPLLVPLAASLVVANFALNSHSSRRRIKLLEKDSPESRLIHSIAQFEKQVEDAMVDVLDNPGVETQPKQDLEHNASGSYTPSPNPAKPIITPVQHKMIASLNRIPTLKKVSAYFHDVTPNTHAVIISRDVKRFDFHKKGEGVIRHWADGFEV